MDDGIHSEQYYILYQLEEWTNHRVSQNIFIDYRSWSGIYETLSMYIHQSDINLKDILFLTPIQIQAVDMTRNGLWAESFREYIYKNITMDDCVKTIIKKDMDYNNVHLVRDRMLKRFDEQQNPKLIIIMNAELLSVKMLKDCNNLFHCQTIVCFDSAMYRPDDSLVNSVKKPIKHVFLNDNSDAAQKFLYNALDKRLIPLSKDQDVRVTEYSKTGYDITKLPRPLISCVPDYRRNEIKNDDKISKGSLVYTNNYNWDYSLEDDKYYIIKGMYLVIDSMSKKNDVIRVTSHPTYTKYKFKTVTDVQYVKVRPAHPIEDLPPWKFNKGGIIVPKVLKDINDARRLYNAVNMFHDKLNLFIV